MKVLVGCLYHETNTFNPFSTNVEDFVIIEGEDCLQRLGSTEVFKNAGVEIIPSIYATALSSGTVTQRAFDYFSEKILSAIKNEPDIDGIWLHLHGSMVVEGIGSGELALLKEVRSLVGNDIPLSLTLDIHANNAADLYKYVNIVCSYKTVPHVDQSEIEALTAKYLLDVVEQREILQPAFIKMPLIICGEKALGSQEPLKSIFNKIKEIEADEKIMSASFFLSHAWSDSENTSTSIFVIPKSAKYKEYADEKAIELENFIMERVEQFTFCALDLSPEEAVLKALQADQNPVFISDSGDNTTAGATGMNTNLLELFHHSELGEKKVLISAIYDKEAYQLLNSKEINEPVELSIGINNDKDTQKVLVKGKLKAKGDLLGYLNATDDKVGDVCTVSIGNLDVAVANRAESFITLNHFTRAGLHIEEYDVVVVKQGYLFDELSEIAKLSILAMTPGATFLNIKNLNYKHQKSNITLI
ncbi:M81 family metallopeptidase [Gracilibacillus alcaliphilus]|uniref:M81 family metallopeptidase n=1 Tax=Gracilibacillus alcaliphilus TaxID=1401441 RepID=UPI00195E79E3|nr:M81 family metallopeptidase [Gracilibacillus alcaliphilus]MBM7676824.1 microcystin degradation protein MlrC [Gracilibacillus alcaliphilus]